MTLIDKSKTYVGYNNKNPKWLYKNVSKVIRTIRVRSLFKRFSLPRICEMLNEMDLNLILEQDILFFEQDKVFFLVSGSRAHTNHCACLQLSINTVTLFCATFLVKLNFNELNKFQVLQGR